MTAIERYQKELSDSLPDHARWQFRDTWVSFAFSRLKTSLLSVTDEQLVGGTMPIDWRRLRVFGDERFENGGAFVCVDESDGSVRRIDVELNDPVTLFSTSVAQFAACFRLVDGYFASDSRSPADLARQLGEADRQAFDAGSHWRLFSDYLK